MEIGVDREVVEQETLEEDISTLQPQEFVRRLFEEYEKHDTWGRHQRF